MFRQRSKACRLTACRRRLIGSNHGRTTMKMQIKMLLAMASVLALVLPAMAQDVPAPGVSPRIDAIRKAGVLRVGVLANAPWLIENTTGGGEHWSGPAWVLAEEYAKRLGVKLDPVLVSHE